MNTQNIKIVLTASKSPISWIIRKLTRSRVSHVFIEFDLWGQRWATDASATGVRIVPAKRARHNVIVEYECKFDGESALQKTMEAYVGEQYDYVDIFILGWIYLWRMIKIKFKYPHRSTKTQICSEYAARFIKNAGISIPWKHIDAVTPKKIDMFCVVHTDLFQIPS